MCVRVSFLSGSLLSKHSPLLDQIITDAPFLNSLQNGVHRHFGSLKGIENLGKCLAESCLLLVGVGFFQFFELEAHDVVRLVKIPQKRLRLFKVPVLLLVNILLLSDVMHSLRERRDLTIFFDTSFPCICKLSAHLLELLFKLTLLLPTLLFHLSNLDVRFCQLLSQVVPFNQESTYLLLNSRKFPQLVELCLVLGPVSTNLLFQLGLLEPDGVVGLLAMVEVFDLGVELESG